MLLVFDVGNTNMVLGIYEGDTLTNSWRINTDHQKSSDEYGILINNLFEYHRINMRDVKNIIISSVVPDVMHSLENFCIKYCGVEPLIVGPGIKTGLNIKYDNPKQVGADRIVNAVAAIEKYGYPSIIVDFGTATTFCAISDKGEYLGGSICPGIKISSEALFHEASKGTRCRQTCGPAPGRCRRWTLFCRSGCPTGPDRSPACPGRGRPLQSCSGCGWRSFQRSGQCSCRGDGRGRCRPSFWP